MKNTIQHPKRGRLSCRIYDNGGESYDRYTACFKGAYHEGYGMIYPYVAFNEAPFHPLGFGQHGENRHESIDGKHLGKRISFDDLSEQAQQFVMQSI